MKLVSNVTVTVFLILWTAVCFRGFYQFTYGELKSLADTEASLLFLIFGLAQSVFIGLNLYNIFKEEI